MPDISELTGNFRTYRWSSQKFARVPPEIVADISALTGISGQSRIYPVSKDLAKDITQMLSEGGQGHIRNSGG